jgi:predicted DNA-binding transcriptional regulator AlpA
MKNLNEKQAADLLGCSAALMRRMRREGRGPRWTKIGRLVRYPDTWLLEYIETHATPPGASEAQRKHLSLDQNRVPGTCE